MKSFISYVGGKSRLSKKILPLFPEHHCYVEVFCGASWMLFAKEASKAEIINDINKDLITLYRVIQHHLEAFVQEFKWVLIHRDEWDRQKKVDPSTLTDIQRAARFYYLLRNAYGSILPHASNFNVKVARPPSLNLLRIEEELSSAHLRLGRVTIENRNFKTIIPRCDKENTFFYIDPPYWNCESGYGKSIFSKEDFAVLRDLLLPLKGKFLLSINDVPEIREIFSAFRVKEVTTTYTLSGNIKPVHELLIMNYEPV